MLSGTFSIRTTSHMEMVDITDNIQSILRENSMADGFCYLFNPHTTAGLTINEGADPDVKRDIIGALKRIVPMDYPYRHAEGNSPSHIMASLMGCSLTIAVNNKRLELGTWQRVFFCEFDGPRTRKIQYRIDTKIQL